jgi:Protein of unknown function (DUF3352)
LISGRILFSRKKEGWKLGVKRRHLIPIALLSVALAACGSSSKSGSPLPTELSYFPSSSPLVATIETDPSGSAIQGVSALVNRFPLASFGEAALKSKLQQAGINYDSDVRPLFGNPIAFGATSSTLSGSASKHFLIVWITKDAGKLGALVKKIPHIHSTGSHAGATIYQSGGSTALAVDGATVLLAPSVGDVDTALDRHAQGGGLSESDYTRAFTGLPSGGVVRLSGNLTTVLSQPSAANARQIPWVAAFRGYAATVSASSSGLTFNYRLDTTGASLTSSQLPFAPGTTAPALAGNLPITVGIHDPAQIATFIESAAQTTSPGGYGKFLRDQAAIRRKTGADLNDIVKLMTGDLIIGSDTKATMARAQVSDPAAARAALAKLMSAPRAVFGPGTRVHKGTGGYAVTNAGGSTIFIGVAGNELVVGKATLAQLREFATAPTAAAAGAQGTVAFRVALVPLLHLALRQTVPSQVQQILSSLGDITGWLASSPSGVTGSATLAVK